jgi:hypothetical protein
MVYIKEGVKVAGIQPEILLGLVIADQVYIEVGQNDLVVTAITDGKHMRGSKHYIGQAVDLRISYFSAINTIKVAEEMKTRLGDDYDVVIEPDHIHLEFNPKN